MTTTEQIRERRRALVDRAFKLCDVDRASELERRLEADEPIADEDALALAFWDAVQRYVDLSDRLRAPNRHVCGWCVKAAGDDDSAAEAAARMTIDEIREHTMTCAHHPLVQELERLRPVHEAAKAWRAESERLPADDGRRGAAAAGIRRALRLAGLNDGKKL